jgi:hypothetical protein
MGMIIIPRNVLVQLIDIFIILVYGSNTENKIRQTRVFTVRFNISHVVLHVYSVKHSIPHFKAT